MLERERQALTVVMDDGVTAEEIKVPENAGVQVVVAAVSREDESRHEIASVTIKDANR